MLIELISKAPPPPAAYDARSPSGAGEVVRAASPSAGEAATHVEIAESGRPGRAAGKAAGGRLQT